MASEPFRIAGSGITATGRLANVTVGFAGCGDASMYQRQTSRMQADGMTIELVTLIAELDGVRTYVECDGERLNIVISRLDLR